MHAYICTRLHHIRTYVRTHVIASPWYTYILTLGWQDKYTHLCSPTTYVLMGTTWWFGGVHRCTCVAKDGDIWRYVLCRSNIWPQCYNPWRLLWVPHFQGVSRKMGHCWPSSCRAVIGFNGMHQPCHTHLGCVWCLHGQALQWPRYCKVWLSATPM